MATGYEVGAYRDLTRIARALERIADALERERQPAPAPEHPDTDRAGE